MCVLVLLGLFSYIEVSTSFLWCRSNRNPSNLPCKRPWTFSGVYTTIIILVLKEAGLASWWEHSPSTAVTEVQFPHSVSYVDWVSWWFSSLLREVFPRVLRFSPLIKNQHLTLFDLKLYMKCFIYWTAGLKLSKLWSSQIKQLRIKAWKSQDFNGVEKPEKVRTSNPLKSWLFQTSIRNCLNPVEVLTFSGFYTQIVISPKLISC